MTEFPKYPSVLCFMYTCWTYYVDVATWRSI